jgi:hypothetical protein
MLAGDQTNKSPNLPDWSVAAVFHLSGWCRTAQSYQDPKKRVSDLRSTHDKSILTRM